MTTEVVGVHGFCVPVVWVLHRAGDADAKDVGAVCRG